MGGKGDGRETGGSSQEGQGRNYPGQVGETRMNSESLDKTIGDPRPETRDPRPETRD